MHADAPPFLVIHGDRDTLVPVADARRFVAELRAVSESPVLYAELAGAEHAFDILPDRCARPAWSRRSSASSRPCAPSAELSRQPR